MRRVPPRLWSCLTLGGAWALFFAAALFSSKLFFDRDLLMTEIPLRVFVRDRLAHGDIPQWFPYEMLGTPFAGTVIATVFHPRTLLFLFFDAAVSTKWSILLAYLTGLIGAYRLARVLGADRIGSVAGAYVFAFGGCAISYGNKVNMLLGLVCVPWALAAVWRLTRRDEWRDVASLGIWWALVFLGGDPQIFLETGLVAGGLLIAGRLRTRVVLRFLLGAALAAAVASAELVPSLAIGDESIRAYWKQTPYLATSWALHPLRLAELLLPRFFPESLRVGMGNVLEGRLNFFVEWIYVGGVALALAVLGAVRRQRTVIVWGTTVVLGLWLALGSHGGLIELWWKALPFFAKFRYPEKYVGIVTVALVPLVAWGVDGARIYARRGGAALLGAGAGLALAAFAAPPEKIAAGVLQTLQLRGMPPAALHALGMAWTNGLLRTGAALALLGAIALLIAKERRLTLAIPALVFVELWAGNGGLLPLAAKQIVEDPGPIARAATALQAPNEPPPRVLPANLDLQNEPLAPDEQVRLDHLTLNADDSTRAGLDVFSVNEPGEQWRVLRTFYGRHGVSNPLWSSRFNACSRVADDGMPPAPDEQPLTPAYDRGLQLVSRPCFPRAFLARADPVATAAEAQRDMRQGLPEDLVVWEGGPQIPESGGTVAWLAAEPEHLALNVSATVASALVVTDAFGEGWSATLDGHPTALYATDAAVRGVVIPAGVHVVEMRYAAPGLRLGELLSALGLLACGALAAAGRRARKQTAPAPV